MEDVTDHPFHIIFFKRLEHWGVCIRFLEPAQNFPLLRVLDLPAVNQFVAMIIKPAGKTLTLFRWQSFDGGFQLYHTHVMNLQFPLRIANQNECGIPSHQSFRPVNRSYASRYFALVFAATSSGNFGPGAVLSQSSVSK
jgi:hypothetical protein